MLELYHAPISTCSQKVRLVLAEKGLEWEGHVLDLLRGDQHRPEYRELNPHGVVPTLVDDGRALIESTLINEYLDDAYSDASFGAPLRPRAPAERHAMRLWTKYLDEVLHPACGTVTYAIAMRPAQLARPREEVLAVLEKIPSRFRRQARKRLYEEGVESALFAPAMRTYVDLLDKMESALADRAHLAGDDYSLADAGVTPYLVRLDHLSMAVLWQEGRRPQVADWYRRVGEREAFEKAIAEQAPAVVVERMRSVGAAVWDRVSELVEGER